MEFGIEKCAMLFMRRDKTVKSEETEFSDREKTKSLEEKEGYRYLRVLEADEVLCKDMKE